MLQPTSNNLHLVPYERPDESLGGIIIPDAFKTDTSKYLWIVTAVGPGARTKNGVRVPCECAVGDLIHLDSPFVVEAIAPIDSHRQMLYTVSEDHVVCILEA